MINGKKYIGQKILKNDWRNYLGSGIHISRAIKKYGKENFSREIVAITYSKKELDKLEIEFIKNHNAVYSEDYYNLNFGGGSNAGLHWSDESKKKMSDAKIGKTLTDDHKQHMRETRINFSEEKKQEISNISKGKILSEETKNKISESKKGENSYMYGKHQSEERKLKIGKANMKFDSKEVVIDIRNKYNSGNYTQKQLGEEYSVEQATISNIINFKGAYK